MFNKNNELIIKNERLILFHSLNSPNIKKLKGPLAGAFRFRIGEWRVIYRIDKSQKQVIVLLIVHRKNAYR